MSEKQTERFNTTTYESARKYLQESGADTSSGLDSIIAGQKKGKDIQALEAKSRSQEFTDMESLLASLEISSPSAQHEQKTPIASMSQYQTLITGSTPVKPTITTKTASKNIQQPVTPQNLSQAVNPLQSSEKQLQDIRDKLAKMPLEINGKSIDLNISEFSFEKQANGGYKVIHPRLESVSDTPIHIDAQGNFQTQSIELRGWKLRLIGIEPGTYSIAQKPDKLLIAKK